MRSKNNSSFFVYIKKYLYICTRNIKTKDKNER